MEKLVLVEWIDSHSMSGWNDTDQVLRDIEDHDFTCWTAGWLIKDEEDYIALASSKTSFKPPQTGQYGDVFKIPRVAVRDISPLYKRQK